MPASSPTTTNSRRASPAAGEATGEKVWRLPLAKAYDKLINSKFADMKNTGGRHASSITAAQFLQRFVNDVPWAHLDIAGTGMARSPDRDQQELGLRLRGAPPRPSGLGPLRILISAFVNPLRVRHHRWSPGPGLHWRGMRSCRCERSSFRHPSCCWRSAWRARVRDSSASSCSRGFSLPTLSGYSSPPRASLPSSGW